MTQSLKTCFFRIGENGVLSVAGPWLCEASLGSTLKGIMPVTILMQNYSFKGQLYWIRVRDHSSQHAALLRSDQSASFWRIRIGIQSIRIRIPIRFNQMQRLTIPLFPENLYYILSKILKSMTLTRK